MYWIWDVSGSGLPFLSTTGIAVPTDSALKFIDVLVNTIALLDPRLSVDSFLCLLSFIGYSDKLRNDPRTSDARTSE